MSDLIQTVEDVDAVFVPAEDPALSEETAEQTELSFCWTVSSDWTRTRKQLKLRNLMKTGGQTERRLLSVLFLCKVQINAAA